jgi:shikimate dehydrogenase
VRGLTGKAKLAGVVGWPVAQSLSPRLHGFWLEALGIDGAYVPLAVRPETLRLALRALPLLGFRGVNVTLPHKEAALAVMDRVSLRARRIGAVNTVVVHEAGALAGDNTDGYGFRENLLAQAPEWRAAAGPAVLLGAGGAARAIAVGLLDEGVPELRLANRTDERALALAREIGGPVRPVPWAERQRALSGAALLVNATSLGMLGQEALEIDLSSLPAEAVVCDIVYRPLLTPLLLAARARGHAVVDGLGMLLHQARPGFAAWFGVEPRVTPELRAHLLESLGS